jgi:hypothetical protein
MNAQQSADKFREQLALWAKSEGENILREVRQTIAAIQQEVVIRTPLKTGRAASSWRIELGGPNFDINYSIDDEDPGTWISKSQALAHAQQDVSNLARLSMHEVYDAYISNGNSYISELEKGSSDQAVAGYMAAGAVHHAATFLPVLITGSIEEGG